MGTADLDRHLVVVYGELAEGMVRVRGYLRTGLLRTSAGVLHRSAIRAPAIERDPPRFDAPPLPQRQTVQTLLLDLSTPFE